MENEGELDPWASSWLDANPLFAGPLEDLSPELLELARGPVGAPPKRHIGSVRDDTVDGVPVRIYRNDEQSEGVVVYFHGGGFVVGSIGLMDNVARELAYGSGTTVISVGYRLAPEHPFPAGLDDCECVTRWAVANAESLGTSADRVVVAGESAGGNLAAAVALRLRDSGGARLAGQALIYPAVAGGFEFPSTRDFDGLVISRRGSENVWAAYSGGSTLDSDPYAVPLCASSLEDLPPTLVILGGCDMLRDEGRAYARRLLDDGVDVREICYPGQPHGFMNFEFPAAADAFAQIGDRVRTWVGGATQP